MGKFLIGFWVGGLYTLLLHAHITFYKGTIGILTVSVVFIAFAFYYEYNEYGKP